MKKRPDLESVVRTLLESSAVLRTEATVNIAGRQYTVRAWRHAYGVGLHIRPSMEESANERTEEVD